MNDILFSPISLSMMEELIEKSVQRALNFQVTPERSKKPIKGIRGLSQFAGVSISKAEQLKKSGRIRYFQDGRTILFDPEQLMEDLTKMEELPDER